MVSQLSFFLNLSSSLLGAPDDGFPKVMALLFPRRLTFPVLFGIACTCFSVPLCAELYIQLRLMRIQHQLNVLNQLVEHRTTVHNMHKRKLEKIMAVKNEVRRDMKQWKESRNDLDNMLIFVLFDRELPYYPDDNVDSDPSLVWNQQDKEIRRRFFELTEFRVEIEEKVQWVEKASAELDRSTEDEEGEVKRMQGKISRLLA